MQRVPITRDGYERLKIELQRLQREERPAVIKAIEEARAHGDISENAEYEAAKEKQGLIETRINDLTQKLGFSEIIDPTDDDNGRITWTNARLPALFGYSPEALLGASVARLLADPERARFEQQLSALRGSMAERLSDLTPREIEVLRLIAAGHTAKEAARRLAIAPKTANNHIQNLYAKIGVTTRAGAALYALERGLVQPGNGSA
mgnify:CR=1 FL=1